MRRAAWAAGRMGTIERDWAVGEMLASCAMGMGRACTYGTEVPSLLPTGGPGVILCYLPAGACPGLVFLGVTVHVDGVWRGRRATCSRRGGGEGGEENGRRGKMVRSRRMGAGSHERNKVGEGMGTGAWERQLSEAHHAHRGGPCGRPPRSSSPPYRLPSTLVKSTRLSRHASFLRASASLSPSTCRRTHRLAMSFLANFKFPAWYTCVSSPALCMRIYPPFFVLTARPWRKSCWSASPGASPSISSLFQADRVRAASPP